MNAVFFLALTVRLGLLRNNLLKMFETSIFGSLFVFLVIDIMFGQSFTLKLTSLIVSANEGTDRCREGRKAKARPRPFQWLGQAGSAPPHLLLACLAFAPSQPSTMTTR